MKLRAVLAASAAIAAVALACAGCTGKDAVNQTAGNQFRFVTGTSPGKTYPVGDRKPAGNFSEQLLDGKGTFTLGKQRGKVVVINFWATWCSPCQVETPQFDTVYRQYKDKGVQFVGIDTKDIRSKAQSFVSYNNITYPMIYDEAGATAVRLGRIPALSLPFTVLVDKQGRVAGVYLNVMSPKDLEPLLNQLLAET